MPQSLLARIGPDTLRKLEAAAIRRYAEADTLRTDERLGAIYLFGYTVEIRLKAAYYRLTGVSPNQDLSQRVPGQPSSPRQVAEDTIRVLLSLSGRAPVGHHLTGWARLLIDKRRSHILGALPTAVEQALWTHTQNAALFWRETLRYHANRPYDWELNAVAGAARWLKRNYRRLWS